MKKVLILGHARHGKDTVAEFMRELFECKFESSSIAACRIFLYDTLKDKYNYSSFEECFEDRIYHREEWHDLIVDYNKDNRARLASEILKNADIYVGMRSDLEVNECIRQGLFDLVIGVFDPRKPLESPKSFNIDLWEVSDIVIPNSGSLEMLKTRVSLLGPLITDLEPIFDRLYEDCRHGDAEHQQWLRDKFDSFIKGGIHYDIE